MRHADAGEGDDDDGAGPWLTGLHVPGPLRPVPLAGEHHLGRLPSAFARPATSSHSASAGRDPRVSASGSQLPMQMPHATHSFGSTTATYLCGLPSLRSIILIALYGQSAAQNVQPVQRSAFTTTGAGGTRINSQGRMARRPPR